MSMWLYDVGQRYTRFLEMIEDEEISDEDIIRDTIEAMDGEIEEAAEVQAKIIKSLDKHSESLEEEIERLKRKNYAIKRRKEAIKTGMKNVLSAADKKKIKTPLFTIYIAATPPRLVLDNPDIVPSRFRIPQPEKIDNAGIKKEIQAQNGKPLPYAHLEQGTTLNIR